MMNAERTIDLPAFQYVGCDTMKKEIDECERREKVRTGADGVHNFYRKKYRLKKKNKLEISG